MEMIGHAPANFTITPRNPAHQVTLGGRHMAFVNVSSPPNAWDLERGKRPGDFETFREFMKLTQYFNCIHVAGGYPVEPIDIHASERHLDCGYEKLVLTDKVIHAYSLGAERVEDVIEMVRLAATDLSALVEILEDAGREPLADLNNVPVLLEHFPRDVEG